MTWGSVVRFLFQYFDTSKKKLTLARISPRNIYLNLFGGAHFHWRSLKACNIAKKTCLSYVWTFIFPWSFSSLFVQVFVHVILRLFRARSSKIIECRFSLKRQKQPPDVFCKKRCSQNFVKFTGKHLCQSLFFKKEALAQVFACQFCKIYKNAFFTEHLLTTASDAYVR